MATINLNAGSNVQSAIDGATPGDFIDFNGHTFYEAVDVRVPGLTLVGNGATISGAGYTLPNQNAQVEGDPSLGGTPSNFVPMVRLTANDTVMKDGFTITESFGRALNAIPHSGTISNITVQDVTIHSNRHSAINIQNVNNWYGLRIEAYNNVIFAPYSRSANFLNWPHALNTKFANGVIWEACNIYQNWGEGLGAGRWTRNFHILNCNIANNYALLLYLHYCRNGIVEGNYFGHTGVGHLRGNEAFPCISIKGEPKYWNDDQANSNKDIVIRNNIMVGTEELIVVGGGAGQTGNGQKDIDIYHNTFVQPISNGSTAYGIRANDGDHENINVWGNIFDIEEDANTEAINIAGSVRDAFDFSRGNHWRETPPAYVQDADDTSGDPQLVDKSRPTDMSFNRSDYYIGNASSPAIGAVSGNAIVTRDVRDVERGPVPHDYGAMEYDADGQGSGSGGGGGSTVVAAKFWGGPRNTTLAAGQANATITLENASDGNTSSAWTYKAEPSGTPVNFSNSNAQFVSVTLPAGIYTIELSINGGASVKTKTEYITILPSPSSAPTVGSFVIAHQTKAIGSSVSFSFPELGSLVPKAWKVILSEATTTNAQANHSKLSQGFGVSGTERCAAIYFEDGQPTSDAQGRNEEGVCLMALNDSGNTIFTGSFTPSAGGGDLAVTSGYGSQLVTVVVYAGNDYEAAVGTVALTTAGTPITTSLAFTPNMVDLGTAWDEGALTSWGSLSIGFLSNGTQGVLQGGIEHTQKNGTATTDQRGRVDNQYCLYRRALGKSGDVFVTGSFGTDEFTLTPSGNNPNDPVFYLAHKFPTDVWCGFLLSRTDTDPHTYTQMGWQPYHAEFATSLLDEFADNVFSDKANVLGLGVHSEQNGTTMHVKSSDYGNTDMVEKSLVTDRIIKPDVTGFDYANGNGILDQSVISFQPNGIEIDTQIPYSTPTYNLFWAVRRYTVTPAIMVTPANGTTPLTVTIDLTGSTTDDPGGITEYHVQRIDEDGATTVWQGASINNGGSNTDQLTVAGNYLYRITLTTAAGFVGVAETDDPVVVSHTVDVGDSTLGQLTSDAPTIGQSFYALISDWQLKRLISDAPTVAQPQEVFVDDSTLAQLISDVPTSAQTYAAPIDDAPLAQITSDAPTIGQLFTVDVEDTSLAQLISDVPTVAQTYAAAVDDIALAQLTSDTPTATQTYAATVNDSTLPPITSDTPTGAQTYATTVNDATLAQITSDAPTGTQAITAAIGGSTLAQLTSDAPTGGQLFTAAIDDAALAQITSDAPTAAQTYAVVVDEAALGQLTSDGLTIAQTFAAAVADAILGQLIADPATIDQRLPADIADVNLAQLISDAPTAAQTFAIIVGDTTLAQLISDAPVVELSSNALPLTLPTRANTLTLPARTNVLTLQNRS